MSWLAEADLLNLQPAGKIEQQQAAALLEANWLVRRGANLKLTAEVLEPDRGQSGNLQTRFSVVGEYTPMQYVQLRLGARWTDDHSAQYQAVNQAFLEVHAYLLMRVEAGRLYTIGPPCFCALPCRYCPPC